MRVLQIAINKSPLLQGFGMLQSRESFCVPILQVGCTDTVGGASVTVSIMIIIIIIVTTLQGGWIMILWLTDPHWVSLSLSVGDSVVKEVAPQNM